MSAVATAAAPPALAFDAVRLRIGLSEILRGVTLELGRGEMLALAGPNGSGKTTLLRVASGVLPASAGGVRVRGRPASSYSRRELARELAVVPQDAHVAFPFRAGEIVLMGRSPHLGPLGFETGADMRLAEEAMARVGIASLAERSVLELSGGERQLVLVARALAQAAGILLLDEPTAHLDLRHKIVVLDLLRDFVRSGGSALVVSHDLTLAARTCDRIALLREGALVATGAPADVITPENLRTTFGIDADVLAAPDGAPYVVPRAPAAAGPAAG
ncbi:MAG: ABC transporter ATP-binding protein [Myxococcales bacterium]|nr:ABC transporter ATP-binding protein [Myxococcales bacterium]